MTNEARRQAADRAVDEIPEKEKPDEKDLERAWDSEATTLGVGAVVGDS